MPIYEYKCQKCERHFEKRQSISEDPLKVCEECGGELEKLISLSGFQFKGGGWYVTDYAGSKNASKAESASGGNSDGEKSPSTESTAKPESASNQKGDTAKPAKTETASKKE